MLPRQFARQTSIALILMSQLIMPAQLMAQVAGSTAQPSNLDLSSTAKTVTASGAGVITEGTGTRAVSTSDLLTPAEHVALFQVLNEGKQSILLGNLGNAVGGTFNVGSQLTPNGLSSLLVPQGVTAIQSGSNLNISGNLTNLGSFFAVSQSAQNTTSYISAANIFNQQGGLISSVLPAGGLPGISSAIGNLSLHLTALQDIINAGSIISAGNLTAVAGGSIVNALPSGVSGPGPVMQAMNNLNLVSGAGSIVNSGLLSSITANINITSQLANNILINNIGGRMEALSGLINVRDSLFADKFNLTLWGGDIACRELNLFSGSGVVNTSVEQILGTVNVGAHTAHITAATDALTLGTITLTGDPTFYNTQGSIVLDRDLIFPAEDIAIIANGDIIGNGIQVIDTSSPVNGGHITMIAGANFVTSGTDPKILPPDQDSTSLITVTGGTPGGGKIDLSTIPIIALSSVGQASSGGDITLAAYGGTRPGSGQVLLPSNCPITTGSGINDINGNVTIIAGALNGQGIITGSINTSGAANGTGNIFLLTANPSLTGCPQCTGALQIVNGKIISGAFNTDSGRFPQFLASVSTGDLTSSGAAIDIRAGSNVTTGNITSDGSGWRSGGTVNVLADMLDFSAPTFAIGSNSSNGVRGIISVTGGTAGGGTIGIASSGAGGISLGSTGDIRLTTTSGGQLGLNARNGVLSVPGSLWNLDASGNGNGGLISLSGNQGVVFSGGNVAMSANGSGSGNGGIIAISGSSIVFPGVATLSASAPGNGNAGRISIYGGTNVALTDGTVISATSSGGAGGNITLSSQGTMTTGAKNVVLNAASLTGTGGAATVSAGALSIGNGNFTINADTGAGTGGSISWVADSTTSSGGAVTLNASSRNGDGGFVNFTSTSLTTGQGTLDINASSAGNGWGGLVTFLAPTIKSGGGISVNTDSPVGWGLINASVDSFTGSGNLALSARATNAPASGMGGGGTVNLSSTAPTGSVALGAGPGKISIDTSTTSSGTAAVDGGIVSVSMGRNLSVDGSGLNTAVGALNGNGAQITLGAGSSGQGILQVTGAIDASGTGTGNAGNVALSYADANPFNSVDTSGAKALNTANIKASASGLGKGGTISFANNASSQALAAELHGTFSTTSTAGSTGAIKFASPLQDVRITGDASLLGQLDASGKLVSVNLSSPAALTVGSIKSNSGDVTVQMQAGQILLSTPAAKIDSAASLSITGPSLTNNGKLTAVSTVNLGNSTGSLSVSGTGSIAGASVNFNSGTGSVAVSQGSIGGTIGGTAAKAYSVGVAAGGLNAGSITASSGSLSLTTSGGALTLTDNAALTAREGNILLQNNSVSGSIALRPYATMTATSTTSTSLGRISVVMGGIPTNPVAGTAPADLTVNLLNGGQIYFGTSGIASGCCNHTATVNGSVVIFDTGAMPASSISLTTNNSFNASSRPTVVVRPLPPGRGGIPPGHGGLPPGLGGFRPPGLGGTPPGHGGAVPGLTMLNILEEILRSQLSSNFFGQMRGLLGRIAYDEPESEDRDFVPVAYIQPAAPLSCRHSALQSVQTETAVIKQTGRASVLVNSAHTLLLKHGQILLIADRDTTVKCGDCTLVLSDGTIAAIDRSAEAVKVHVLWDRKAESVKAYVSPAGHVVKLSAGQEIVLRRQGADSAELAADNIARRRLRHAVIENNASVTTSEFSLASLFASSEILSRLAASNERNDRQLVGKLMKMGVCLMTVTSSHGPYSTGRR